MGLRDSIANVTPAWLNGFVGTRFLYSMAVTLDAVWEWTRQGVRARFPEAKTPGALAPQGADRLIERGFDEDDDTYISRLLIFRDLVRFAGNPQTLLYMLWGYINPHYDNVHTVPSFKLVTNNSWWWTFDATPTTRTLTLVNRGSPANWRWDGMVASAWARAWVILSVPSSLWVPEGDWGVGDGSTWGDGGVWGFTATPAQVAGLLAVVRNWKSARTIVEVLVSFDDTLFPPLTAYPSVHLPSGNWDRWINRDDGARYLGSADQL